MELYVRRGKKLGPKDGLVLAGLFEGETELPAALGAVDAANGGTISRLLEDGEFRAKGRPPETVLVHLAGKGPRHVLLHGLGGEYDRHLGTGMAPQRAPDDRQQAILQPIHRIGVADSNRQTIAINVDHLAALQPGIERGAGHL